MAKVPTIPFLLLRRSYKVTADSATGPKAAATTVKTATTESGGTILDNNAANQDSEQKQTFWMRDRKTGNWIPETHFEEVDAAELREKLLRNSNNKNKL